jgi:DNA-binding NarL/FixJ family response regulator
MSHVFSSSVTCKFQLSRLTLLLSVFCGGKTLMRQNPQGLQPLSLIRPSPACVIHCYHPLVMESIRHAVCAEAALRSRIKVYAGNSQPLNDAAPQVLIIDTCSVENWLECLEKWQAQHGITIALVSPEAYVRELELQLLYLGTAGVLSFNDNLIEKLPKAIYAVANERLWIRREVLSLFIKKATQMLRKVATSDHRLTRREGQIFELMQQKAPNRAIAQRLAISERTVKFHVSNLLRKLQLSNRRQLQSSSSSTSLTCPDWLLPKDEIGILKTVVFPATTAPKTA